MHRSGHTTKEKEKILEREYKKVATFYFTTATTSLSLSRQFPIFTVLFVIVLVLCKTPNLLCFQLIFILEFNLSIHL